jgi:hypothetical protein
MKKYKLMIVGTKEIGKDEPTFVNVFTPNAKQAASGIKSNEFLKVEVSEVISGGFSLSSGAVKAKNVKRFNIWAQDSAYSALLDAITNPEMGKPLAGDPTKIVFANTLEGAIKTYPCRPSKQWNQKEKRYEQDTVKVLLRNGDVDYEKRDRVVTNFSIFVTADFLEEENKGLLEAAWLKEKERVEAHPADAGEPIVLETIPETPAPAVTPAPTEPVKQAAVPA